MNDAIVDAIDRHRAGRSLVRTMRAWGWSQAEAARLFGVSRQAVGKWLRQGPPLERATALSDLAAATDLLLHYLKHDRIPAVVRRPVPALGGLSLTDLLVRSDSARLLDACREMFAFERIAGRHGGRWNPPGSFAVLYLNQGVSTARENLRAFIARWPYGPEDLRDDTGPALVGCLLPRRQVACDAHSGDGLHAAGLPPTYPLHDDGTPVPHAACQAIGVRVRAAGLCGVRARSAGTRHGDGRELAWFPASRRSTARGVESLAFTKWYRGRAAFGRAA